MTEKIKQEPKRQKRCNKFRSYMNYFMYVT